MSKAFVSEDSAVAEELELPSRPDEPLPITAAGHARLLAERASLARDDEGTRHRARVLERVLATVVVTAPMLVEGGAGFGCVVEVADERGVKRTYTFVGPDEVDPASGRISLESPIGRAIRGRRAGDIAELERAGEEVELRVLSVRLGD